MNENHDERGRFATGDSVSVTGRGSGRVIRGSVSNLSGRNSVEVRMHGGNHLIVDPSRLTHNDPAKHAAFKNRQKALSSSGRFTGFDRKPDMTSLPKGATPVTFKGYND